MKTKIITALVAFFATFAISVGLVLLFTPFTPIDESQVTVKLRNNQYARDITNLLRQDISNGLERRDDYDESSEADSVADYADKSGQINDEGLPPEFQSAWRKHMAAWHDYSEFLRDMDSLQNRKNYSDEQIRRIAYEHNSRINSTWYQVLRVGKRYGAEIPANAY